MGRSIIRSKIFAKQNLPSTGGGGGGSAISVSDEGTLLTSGVTSFNFTGYGVTASAVGNAVTVTVDNHLAIQVKNATGSPVVKGTVCYLKTGSSSATVPEILLADATSEATSSKTLGIIHTTIPNGQTGLLVVNGELEGTGSEPLDTSAYTIGTKLWLSTTPGQVTDVPPVFPNHTVFIGHVTRSQSNNGRILVEIQNGFEMSELHDTKFTSLANRDVMMYDSTTGPRPFWYNQKMVISNTAFFISAFEAGGLLITGATYLVTDSPAGWTILLEATSPNTFNPKGVAIYSGCKMDCWYDLAANTPFKIYDPKYNNTVEGWSNIQNFKWNNPGWIHNYICGRSTIYIDGSTGSFNFCFNTITEESVIYLQGTLCSGEITHNTLSGKSSLNLQEAVISLNVKYNNLYSGSVSLTNASFDDFSDNEIYVSTTVVNLVASTFGSFARNLIKSSALNMSSTNFGSFSYNDISDSTITSFLFSDFSYNKVFDSDIILSFTYSNTHNFITQSYFDLGNETTIQNCHIDRLGFAGSLSLMYTAITYIGCSYTLNAESTFYVEYSLDNPAIYSSKILTMQNGNLGDGTFIGKIILAGSAGSYDIEQIIHYPANNFLTFVIKEVGTFVSFTDAAVFFILYDPWNITGKVSISKPLDYCTFSGIASPIRTAPLGQMVLIDNKNY